MYTDSPQGLWMMDYGNEVHCFINYAPSNSRNISGMSIRCLCKRCKNKKVYQSKCCNDASSTKKVYGEILVLVCTQITRCSSQ